MSTPYPSYRTSTNNNNTFYRSPKFNIATEPHYKITEYLEEESINIPNKKVLNKIITTALNKKKYQGRINLNVPGNKDVITDSDSEEHYVKEDNIKKINKNMLKQNGCANLIIKKIESQAPQRNEEYYKFTNQKKIFANNDPIYGTRTLTNWNHKIINQERPLYIQTDQNIYNNNANAYYNNDDKIIPTDSNLRNQVKQILKGDNNYHFNSTVDLRQINYNPRQKPKQVYEINQSPNQQVDYESSADAEQGSSSYVYYPSKKKNINSGRKINNNYKENEFSSQSISNNEEPYVKKNLEIKTQKLRGKNNYKIPSNRPTINELINLNYNNKGFSVLQNKFNQKLIKNVVKIQSNWRGYFTRETIKNNINLIRFIVILGQNIKNKYMEHIANLFNEMKYLKVRSEKNENYDDLLKDYNLLLNEYNKIEKELNRIKKIKTQKGNGGFDNLNIVNKENDFEILDIYLESSKDDIKQEIKEENVKKEILELEKKERFNIIGIKNKDENIEREIKEESVKKEIFEPEKKERFNIIAIENREKNIEREIKEENVKKEIFEPEKKERFNIMAIENREEIIKQDIKEESVKKEIFEPEQKERFNIIAIENKEEIIKHEIKEENVKKEIIEPEKKERFNIIGIKNKEEIIKQGIKEENVKKEIFEPEHKEQFSIINIKKKEEIIKKEIKEESVKKEIFEPEQKEQFSIINIKNIKAPEKESKLRAKYKKQNSENENEKSEEDKPIITKEPENKPEKKDLLIVESQKEMNIELKLQRKFLDNMISDHNNDISIIQTPVINNQNLLGNKKEINPKFKNDKLIIVKKINLNINKRKEKEKTEEINKKNYTIEKNNIYIKKIKIKKKDEMTETNEEKINNQNNFNNKNEIEKNETLEINPKEMKKVEEKIDIKIKEFKPSKTFTEKAKNHMMKMILPIRLKGTLKEYIRKRTFKFLKELKEN